MAKLNKWQQRYLDEYYEGVPKRMSKEGKEELELLGKCKTAITVHFPDHVETYKITEDDVDMPNGLISVCVLAENLRFWKFRGFTVEF